MAKPKSRLQIWTQYGAARLVFGLLRCLPNALANNLAQLFTRVLDKSVPKLRRVAHANLSFAYPEKNEQQRDDLIDGVFQTVARVLTSISRFPTVNKINVRDFIHYEGLENYHAAKAKGRGILVATAHLGNWEFSAFTHAYMTEAMNVMVRPLDNPLLDRWVEKRRQSSGNTVIGKRDAARSVLRALKNNEAVGILIDQNSASAEGVFVNFFGKQACANSAFVKLAMRSGAAVIPGFALWSKEQQTYVLRFYPEIPLSGDVTADTASIHALFEQVIREYPDQWMWIHRRWKTRPEGERFLY